MDVSQHSAMTIVLSVALIVLPIQASHFRGGIIQTKTVNDLVSGQPVLIEFTYRVAWRRSYSGLNCTQEHIDGNTLSTGQGSLTCKSGCSGSLSAMSYYCSDFNEVEDWTVGERSFQTSIPWTGELMASFTGGAWVELIHGGGSWEVQTQINFDHILAVGRKQNSSPLTKMSPLIKLQSGCQHTISVPVADADLDDVRCRWSESSLGECAGVCQTFPASLNRKECTLTFDAITYSTAGYYAVALQVEDFVDTVDTTALSSVPIQFLVYVYNYIADCSTKPTFGTYTKDDTACIAIPPGGTYSDRLTVVSPDPTAPITSISTQSPPGLKKSTLKQGAEPNTWYVDISWTPTAAQQGPNIFCYKATDAKGRDTDQRCITLVVGVHAPSIIPGNLNPAGVIDPDKDTLNIKFNLPILRPQRAANIRIYDKDTNLEAASIDVSSSQYITFPDTTTLAIHLQDLNLKPSTEYYILLDDGAVTGTTSFKPDSPRTWDQAFLTFKTTPSTVPASTPSPVSASTPSPTTASKLTLINILGVVGGGVAAAGLMILTLLGIKKYCFKKIYPQNNKKGISNIAKTASPDASNGVPNGKTTYSLNSRMHQYIV